MRRLFSARLLDRDGDGARGGGRERECEPIDRIKGAFAKRSAREKGKPGAENTLDRETSRVSAAIEEAGLLCAEAARRRRKITSERLGDFWRT